MHEPTTSRSIMGLDVASRWRPNCHCWTSEPLFHA
jgi:hypothetical protein